MASCDICGRENAGYVVSIEGAKMTTCRNCAGHGKILYQLQNDTPQPIARQTISTPLQEEEIVEDYAKKIRSAREKLGLPVTVVAERVSERASYLEGVERGQMKLTLASAKKLEKELGIKLIEKVADIGGPTPQEKIGSKRDITLSDFIVQKKK